MSYNLRIIQEYFQPKIGRKIRIFSLGRKNNILIKKKECIQSGVLNFFATIPLDHRFFSQPSPQLNSCTELISLLISSYPK